MKKKLYLFSDGRKKRWEKIQSGEPVPKEFLFGVPYFAEKGWRVDILELNDFLMSDKKSISKRLRGMENWFLGKVTHLSSCSHLLDTGIAKSFNEYEIIVAGNDFFGLGLMPYVRRGLLKTPMVFFVMGMLANLSNLSGNKLRYQIGKSYYRQLVKNSRKCIFLGAGEHNFACRLFGEFKDRFEFLPFAVDTDFWCPQDVPQRGEYVLFIGNDRNRDYDLLLRIAGEMKERHFKFITRRMSQSSVPENVELIAGDWREAVLSDIEIREYIRNCAGVILPLKQSLQPSGQSVCQQAMACGRPVIISKTEGFWDPENFQDRIHLYFAENNQINTWTGLIRACILGQAECRAVGANARKLMTEKYNIRIFGEKLERIISQTLKEYSK